MIPTRFACAAVLLALGLLSGCALPRMIDSDVQSFTTGVPAVAPATYRFERLPSQQLGPTPFPLETMAAPALAKVGLSLAAKGEEATARYAVQVSLEITGMQSPYSHGVSMGIGMPLDGLRRSWMDLALEPQWYRHVVRLLLRDAAGGQIVFETSATFDGPWNDTANLLPTMLTAALQGYPNPPVGPRKVVIELPAPAKAKD